VSAVLSGGACSDGGDSEATGGAAPDGAALYQQSCASCHGTDLRGTDLGPSHLSQVYEPGHHPDASFRTAIAEGARAHHWDFGDMPAVPGLSDAEVDAVIAYIRDQQEQRGFEPYPPG
jgi:mono/diheme cytochrome c family protein